MEASTIAHSYADVDYMAAAILAPACWIIGLGVSGSGTYASTPTTEMLA